MRHRTVGAEKSITDTEVVDTRTGRFLVLERYSECGEFVVLAELDRDAFIARAWPWPASEPIHENERRNFGARVRGSTLSDVLVNAFDCGAIEVDGYEEHPRLAFALPDGRVMHQHSI